VLVYFAYLAGMALVVPVPSRRRLLVLAGSSAVLILVSSVGMAHVWPLAYLLAGYWLPALLVRSPNALLEERLLAIDRTLFGVDGLIRFARRAPRPIVEYLEFAYLMCYLVVPVGFAWLVWGGFAAEAGRYWSVVLSAAYVSYGVLPWAPTRAPRALETAPFSSPSIVRRVNLVVLDRASVQWNTFPSGHSAASAATAMAVAVHMPWAGCVLMVVAISIAVGSVAGRYHYVADAVAGFVVAVAAFTASAALAR
jgi:membrane-associated phospholipid phosphatase